MGKRDTTLAAWESDNKLKDCPKGLGIQIGPILACIRSRRLCSSLHSNVVLVQHYRGV